MTEIFIWIAVFVIALAAVVKGADWLLGSAERIGLAVGLSPFIVGVVIVGAGTSFPELVSSIVAVIQGAKEIVAANAIGSNIANILLIVGFSAVLGKQLVVTKSLIDLDLPLLAITTVIFLAVAADANITVIESALLLVGYGIYLGYTILHIDDTAGKAEGMAYPIQHEQTARKAKKSGKRPQVQLRDILLLLIGIAALSVGAKYLIDAVIQLSDLLGVATGVISLIAVAVGTSLPELLVSTKAALAKNSEVALGNIFGSNVFNVLVVVGLPGLFGALPLDTPTFAIGLPAMALATLLFIISGISRRVHVWEGYFYLLAYAVFVGKSFNLF